MTVPYSAQERLVILHLGGRRLAMPLSDVALYAPAMEQVAVRDNPVWMAGAVASWKISRSHRIVPLAASRHSARND